jgi:hypothetical protein
MLESLRRRVDGAQGRSDTQERRLCALELVCERLLFLTVRVAQLEQTVRAQEARLDAGLLELSDSLTAEAVEDNSLGLVEEAGRLLDAFALTMAEARSYAMEHPQVTGAGRLVKRCAKHPPLTPLLVTQTHRASNATWLLS